MGEKSPIGVGPAYSGRRLLHGQPQNFPSVARRGRAQLSREPSDGPRGGAYAKGHRASTGTPGIAKGMSRPLEAAPFGLIAGAWPKRVRRCR
jgi:hypothetical protein